MSAKNHRIDVHYHLIPEPYVMALTDRGITGASVIRFPRWTPEIALKQMEKTGVDVAVTSLSTPGVWFGDAAFARKLSRTCNEFQARMRELYPTRFGALAFLPLPDVEGALLELEYALDTLHHDGVVLLSNVDGRYLGDPDYEELFAELDRRAAVVFVHPSDDPRVDRRYPLLVPLLDRPLDTTRTVVDLLMSGRLTRYPNIRWILAHGGGTTPYTAHRLAAGRSEIRGLGAGDRRRRAGTDASVEQTLATLRRMYFDTSSPGDAHLAAIDAFAGTDQALFGTDGPWTNLTQIGIAIRGLVEFDGFDAAQLRAVERDNAQRLFPRFAQAA